MNNNGYFHGARGGYPPQQNNYVPNLPYYPHVKKKSEINKIIMLLIFVLSLYTAFWYFARPIQQYATRFYWQNQWRFVEGRAENEKAIKSMLEGFTAALEKKDADAAAAFVHPDKAASYKKMFVAKPEGMITLASTLRKAEGVKMTGEIVKDDASGRLAGVKIVYNKTEYEIQLKKVNDKWYVFSL